MNSLQKALAAISNLEEPILAEFLAAWKYRVVPKDYLLAREHTISDTIFFLQKGIARIYYYKNKKEITEWIAMDEQFFLSITSFFERKPGHLIIQTLEPAEVYSIHNNDLMALADKHHAVEKLLRKMITHSLILSQKRMDAIQFETAHQRYHRLLTESPGIIKRVPLSYIASFLGVTLETLSRIRSSK